MKATVGQLRDPGTEEMPRDLAKSESNHPNGLAQCHERIVGRNGRKMVSEKGGSPLLAGDHTHKKTRPKAGFSTAKIRYKDRAIISFMISLEPP